MAQATMPAPDETSGGGSRARQQSSQHLTVPAGWGAQYGRGGAHRRPHAAIRPTRQDDPQATTIRPLQPDDDPLGIYRHPSPPGRGSRPAAAAPTARPRPAQATPSPAVAAPARTDTPAQAAAPAPAQSAEATAPAEQGGRPATEAARKAVTTAKERSRGLGLHGSEIIGGACASALATGVTSGLGVGGTVFGSAMTSIVIAVAGAVFVKIFSRNRGRKGADRSSAGSSSAKRGSQRGVWARTAGIGLLLTVLTGVIGAIVLSKEVGGSLSQQIVNITSSRYQLQEMWQQAWPYLKEAWQAAHR